MSTAMKPPLTSSPVITRHAANPILTYKDVPYPASLIFNAGVAKFQGRYVMLFRNDYGSSWGDPHFDGTNLGLAFSDDGVHWEVAPQPCWQWQDDEVHRVYDPRITVIDGRCHICFSVNTRHGICGGIAITDDLLKLCLE